MKINVDAALSKNTRRAAVVAIARDGEGTFLDTSALVLEGLSEAEVAEALACHEGLALADDLGLLACHEGLALADDLGLQTVRVAMDCANAARSIQGAGFGSYGPIILEIMRRMESFARVDFVHERRQTNFDAHQLAKSSVSLDFGRHVWLISPPFGVCNIIGDQ
jgi:hypothetical protein